MALDIIPKQEGGKLKAVASGTLPNGKPVVVNADGTVSVVGGSEEALGSPTVFESASTESISATYDSNAQRIVIAYKDVGNNSYGTAIVGTVSGTSISFGTPVVFESALVLYVSATYDTNAQKVVIAYRDQDNSRYGTGIVGTVSGTSISFGSATVFETSESTDIFATYDTDAQKVVVVYRDEGNSNKGTSVVGTVSGTSISFGTPVVFTTNRPEYISATYDTNAQRVVVSYGDFSGQDGTAVVGTVSGTSISFGTPVVFNSSTAYYTSIKYDPDAQKVVIAYRDTGNSDYGTAIVGTVSGTSISFGSPVVFESANSQYISVSYHIAGKKVVIAYQDNPNSSYGTVAVGTVSGTTISFSTPSVFESGGVQHISSIYDANAQKIVIACRGHPDSSTYGSATVFSPDTGNLTPENYIGMSGGVVVPSTSGTKSVYESASSPFTSIVYDSNSNKIIVAYRDNGNSNYGTAVVGTVSGSSITFGTPVAFDTSESVSDDINAVFDSTNNKIVIAWRADSYAGKAVVGTVSGTSISFGSVAQFDSSNVQDVATAFDSSNGKVLICYKKSSTGKALVGTVSGTSISFGSIVNFESGEAVNMSAAFDSSSNKIVIGYADAGNGTYGTAVVGTISGTSVSFGTPVVFETAVCGPTSTVFDPLNNKIVITYSGDSTYGKSIVGTVSGTSISFGSATTFQALAINYLASAFDSTKGQVVCLYNDTSGSPFNTLSKSGTVSGTSISFGSESIVTAEAYSFKVTHDPDNGINIAAFQDSGNSYYGTAIAFNNGTRGQVADGDNATVDIVGTVSSNQASLTAGQQYYVQTDGTIGETPADPSVLAGTAVSATKLLVKT